MHANKKNILLIQVDQLPWFGLSIMDNPNVKTPNLDALVRDGGVLFDNATCQSPICLPSRVSMLAGQYVSSTKQFGFDGFCDRDIEWLQGVTRREGYRNGAFGKFHAASIGLEQWQFDVAVPTEPEDEDFARPKGNHYRAYCKQHSLRWPTDQLHGHDAVTGQSGQARVSRHADPSLTGVEQCAAMSEVPYEHSIEQYTTNHFLDFMNESLAEQQPFFAWLSYDRPHYPTTLPPELFDTLEPEKLALPPLPDTQALTGMPRWLFSDFTDRTSIFHLGEERFRFVLASYYKLMEFIDSEIGRVIKALEENGMLEETVIIFTADHGDEAGFNGLFDKYRRVSSEAVTRIPMILRLPQGMVSEPVAGSIVHAQVENIDIYSTICDAIGVPVPDKVEGRSLLPILRGEAPADDQSRPVFCEDYFKRMVKKDGWKLVYDIEVDQECLLYDMNRDPNQFVNLYMDKQATEQRIELKRELLAFLSARIFGKYTPADEERIEKGLDGNGVLPVLAFSFNQPSIHFLRAGAVIQHVGHHQILVRFYDRDILLFPAVGQEPDLYYRRRHHALPPDYAIIEKYLDFGLRYCMSRIPTVSTFSHREPIHAPLSTAEEADALVSRLNLSISG